MCHNTVVFIMLLTQVAHAAVDTLWVRRYNGPSSGQDAACGVCTDSHGNAYVTGYISVGGPYVFTNDVSTIKYSAEGISLWTIDHNSTWDDDDHPVAITIDDDENILVCGVSMGPEATFDFTTIKYDQMGSIAWTRYINGPWGDHDYATDMLVDQSGCVYMTGYTNSGWMYEDYMTVKCDAQGTVLWVQTYNGDGNGNDRATRIALDGLGNVYVTGRSWAYPGDFDYLTVKYDAAGNEIWTARSNGISDSTDMAEAIAVDNAGNVYVAGRSWTSGMSNDILTVKYDNDGDTVWTRRYDGSAHGDDAASQIISSSSGHIYVAGYSTETTLDFCVIKYDTSGNALWSRTYDGTGSAVDRIRAMAIDGNGDIYVTGESPGVGTHNDYATVKYDGTGNEIWVARYNGPSNGSDMAHDVAIDDSGHVYVTGESFGGPGMYMDYLTIKYSQETGIEEIVAQECLPTMTVRNSIFMDGIEIAYYLPEPSEVTLNVYDIQGCLVNTLLESSIKSGNNVIMWNGLGSNGISLPSGIYILHLTTPATSTTEKIIRVR